MHLGLSFRKPLPLFVVSVCCFAATLNVSTWAASSATTPNALPGQLLQDLQEKTVPSSLQPDTQQQKPAQSQVEDNLKHPKPTQAVDAEAEKKIFIKTIELHGVTLLSTEEIQPLITPLENKKDSFTEIQELTAKLTQLYQKRGYVTSRVYIPAGRIENGVLVLQAQEGHVGKIVVKNGRFFKDRSIQADQMLKPGDPFNIDTLKVSLRRMNEIPDLNVQSTLEPGENVNETDIKMNMVDHYPLHVTPSFDNMGRQTVGYNRVGLQVVDNNVTGFGDNFLTSLSFTQRSFGIVNHYELPLGHHGTKFTFDQSRSTLHLGESFSPLIVKGASTAYTPGITQNLVDTEHYKLDVDSGMDFKQLTTEMLNAPRYDDILRTIHSGITFNEFDAHGVTYIRNEGAVGLDILGATDGNQVYASRVGAGSKYFRYTTSIIRTQQLPFSSYGVFRVFGQYSPDMLVSSEQFQNGGAFTVRGYNEGQLVGDKGLLASGEWRVPCFLAPKKFVINHYSLHDNLQLVTFLDYGLVGVNNPALGVLKHPSVMGTGVGLRLRLTRLLNARIDFAVPLLHQVGDTANFRIHFGLQSGLF
jgi:hemolysin activation/secretion protein